MITITATAESKAKSIRGDESDLGLRVKVQGGGCSGMIYDLSFDDYTDNDLVFHTKDNFHVIVDKRSILYLAGSDITYDDGLMGTGFVIKNPKANSTCGCGESFSI